MERIFVYTSVLKEMIKSDISYLTSVRKLDNFLCNKHLKDVCECIWGIQILSCNSRFFLKEYGSIGGKHVLSSEKSGFGEVEV